MSTGSDGQIFTMSGGLPTWVTPTVITIPVSSVFGRTGDVLGMTGDYLSDQVIE